MRLFIGTRVSDLLTISAPKGSVVLVATYSIDPKRCIKGDDILFLGVVESFPITLSSSKYPAVFVRVRNKDIDFYTEYIYERPIYGT